MTNTSPLLAGSGLPAFSTITPAMVSADLPQLLSQLEAELKALEQNLEQRFDSSEPLRWSQVMRPLQTIGEALRWSWGVVSHLNGVCNSSELRQAHAAQQPPRSSSQRANRCRRSGCGFSIPLMAPRIFCRAQANTPFIWPLCATNGR